MRIKLFLTVLICFCMTDIVLAQNFSIRGIVTDNTKKSIAGSSVVIRSQQNTLFCKGCTSDALGRFEITGLSSGNYNLEVSFIGYSKYVTRIALNNSIDIGEIVLKEEGLFLEGIVITAKMIERFADRKEYILTDENKKQYSNALSALEFLPKIQVLDQNVSSVDGREVKILINGVPSASTDLSTILPSNIAKIDYYTQPPVQYSNMGLGAVINVVTKKNKDGGSVVMNTQNAITTGFGNNVVNFKYNFGNSQVGVKYDINYRNYSKRLLNESLLYSIGGHLYKEDKIGNNSPYAYEEQLAEINFNNSKSDDYLFSTKLSFKSLNRRRSSYQNILSDIDNNELSKKGESSDNDKYMRPVIDIYFNKSFNKKHEFVVNVVGTLYKSKYYYHYMELCNSIKDFETETNINTDKYSLIGDTMYSYQTSNFNLFIGTRYMYNNSKQKNLSGPNKITMNEVYSYVGITGILWKKVNYNISAGVDDDIFTTLESKKYKFAYFRPQVMLGYLICENSDLTLDYEVNTQTPSISNLTYNPYYKDPNYMYVGNPELKPGNLHDISLSYSKNFKKFIINAEVAYEHSRDDMAPVFISNGKDVIETFCNMDYANNFKTSLFLQWYPLSCNILRLRLYTEVSCQKNKFGDNLCSHTGYTIIPSVYIAYKKWGGQMFYQIEKKTLIGQTIKTEPSMAFAEISYKPFKNMTIMAGIRYPFYNSWKQTTMTSDTSVVSKIETERIVNNANMIYINFVYNFSFGKTQNSMKLKMNNEDKDSGILYR